MIWLLPLLLGCGTEETREIQIDCEGMTWRIFHEEFAVATSALPAVDLQTAESDYRCAWLTSNLLDENANIGATERFNSPPENTITPVFWINGEKYAAVTGDLKFDSFDSERKASGTYDVEVIPVEGGTKSYHATGSFSWCEYASEGDCPNTPTDVLEERFELNAMLLGAVEGGVSACVMVHDTTYNTLFFEMQYGTVGGWNVGRYLSPECTFGTDTLPANRFTFRAADVPEKGSYGPFLVLPDPSGALFPDLRMVRPLAMDTNPFAFDPCQDFYDVSTTVTEQGDQCEYSFDDGQIEIYCENPLISWPPTGTAKNWFRLRADCPLVTR